MSPNRYIAIKNPSSCLPYPKKSYAIYFEVEFLIDSYIDFP